MRIFDRAEYIANDIISASLKRIEGDTPPHGHNFFELEYILQGTGVYSIDGQDYPIQSNTLFLMTPANVHTIRCADAEIINVMFQYSAGEEAPDISLLFSNSPVFLLREEETGFIQTLLNELVQQHLENPRYAVLLTHCVLSKLAARFPSGQDNNTSYTRRAMLYMLENFQTGVTLTATARQLGLSPAFFSDLFHRQMGIGFKEALDELRFSYAQKLLVFTELSVKEIQFRSGFYDYANFARRFRQKYGITPTQYRKAHTFRPPKN